MVHVIVTSTCTANAHAKQIWISECRVHTITMAEKGDSNAISNTGNERRGEVRSIDDLEIMTTWIGTARTALVVLVHMEQICKEFRRDRCTGDGRIRKTTFNIRTNEGAETGCDTREVT